VTTGEHQVEMANISFVDAEGSGNITYYVDMPNANPAKIVPQHVLYVPACGMKHPKSIIQFIRKEVNVYFKLPGAAARVGSVLDCEAPLINSLFLLKTTSATVSIAAEVVDDTLISEIF
jgi:hypothetical protein